MKDKNGIEIKTSDVVEITGAYFKSDNGLYFVDRTPGDPAWNGKYYALNKISKSGKISNAKGKRGEWPISIYTNDRFKRMEGDAWNAEHAEIEVRNDIDKSEIKKFFENEADMMYENYDYWRKYNENEAQDYLPIAAFYLNIADSIA